MRSPRNQIDLYKQQAARLREFLAEAGVELKHTHALEAVARIHGERNFHLLSRRAEREDAAAAAKDPWCMLYEQREAADEKPFAKTMRILGSAEDAVGALAHAAADFLDEYPTPSNKCSTTLRESDAHGNAVGKSIAFEARNPRRRLSVEIYPLDQEVDLSGGPVCAPNDDIRATISKRRDRLDIDPVLQVANDVHNVLMSESDRFFAENPAKEVGNLLHDYLRTASKRVARSSHPAQNIWTADERRIGQWRLRLLYYAGKFLFDAFQDGAKGASLTAPLAETVLRAKGRNRVDVDSRGQGTASMRGLSKDDLRAITRLAGDWGARLVLHGDASSEHIPYHDGAPAQAKFLDWAKRHRPEILDPNAAAR